MKKTISTYWPVAMLVPIALAVYLNAAGAKRADTLPHAQITAASVSDEFARAISFGLVEPDSANAMPGRAEPAQQAL